MNGFVLRMLRDSHTVCQKKKQQPWNGYLFQNFSPGLPETCDPGSLWLFSDSLSTIFDISFDHLLHPFLRMCPAGNHLYFVQIYWVYPVCSSPISDLKHPLLICLLKKCIKNLFLCNLSETCSCFKSIVKRTENKTLTSCLARRCSISQSPSS